MERPHGRNSLEALRLRRDMGARGYGIYSMLCEIIAEQGGRTAYDPGLMAYAIGEATETVARVCEGYGLFCISDGADTDGGERVIQLTDWAQPRRGLGRTSAPQTPPAAAALPPVPSGGAEPPRSRKEETKRRNEERERTKEKEEKKKRKEETDDDGGGAHVRESSGNGGARYGSVEAETAELFRSEPCRQALMKNHGVTLTKLGELFAGFIDECRANGRDRHDTLEDCRRHLNSWMRIRLAAEGGQRQRGTTRNEQSNHFENGRNNQRQQQQRTTTAAAAALRRGAEPSAMAAADYEGRF